MEIVWREKADKWGNCGGEWEKLMGGDGIEVSFSLLERNS